jgi:hypothetical protein
MRGKKVENNWKTLEILGQDVAAVLSVSFVNINLAPVMGMGQYCRLSRRAHHWVSTFSTLAEPDSTVDVSRRVIKVTNIMNSKAAGFQ